MSIQPSDTTIQDLIQDLRRAASTNEADKSVKVLLERFVKDPKRAGEIVPAYDDNDVILYEDEAVSIWHCRFMPGFAVPAHDHRTQATIAVYAGAERNDFFKRGSDGTLEKTREVIIGAGQVAQIGADEIHSVACASDSPCCGIHVYLAALSQLERSLFDTERNEELPFTDENYHLLTREDD